MPSSGGAGLPSATVQFGSDATGHGGDVVFLDAPHAAAEAITTNVASGGSFMVAHQYMTRSQPWPAFRSQGAMTMTNSALKNSWTVPQQGQTIGEYLVDGVCGRGEYAVVLSATHTGLAQRVAIRMLLPEWAGDQEVVDRFVREGRAATRIKSQHLVRVFYVGILETGAPYWVLEHLEGNNLADDLTSLPPLSPETDGRFSWPEPEIEVPPRGKGASAKIVLGSVLILGGAAAVAFLGMYSCVHGDEMHVATTQPPRMGIAEHQPTGTVAADMVLPPGASVAPIAPVPIPATAVSAVPPATSVAPPRQPMVKRVHPGLTNVRRYTVEPEPVYGPAVGHREEPVSSAPAVAPAQTTIAAPVPSLPARQLSPSAASSATDDLFDSRK